VVLALLVRPRADRRSAAKDTDLRILHWSVRTLLCHLAGDISQLLRLGRHCQPERRQ
jgi:hypothetical protein